MASTKVSTADGYITIVAVGNNEEVKDVQPLEILRPANNDEPFVTVLSIGNLPVEEEVTIYRLPGEKLGFGLKFEGGTKSAECVRRLFIQSCSPESPAGRAKASWGLLQAGDEILRIDSYPVTTLTRLECVRCLKDSNVAVTLLVKHDITNKFECDENNDKTKSKVSGEKCNDSSALPPPVPPRKLHRKQNIKDLDTAKAMKNSENVYRGPESFIENEIKKNSAKNSPCRPRKPILAPSPPPPEAQVYTDLFSNEKENGIHVAESESDDTGSSISTVIDRLSMYSSFPGSVENSIPSTPTLGPKQLNFQNVFSCLDSIGQSLLADMPPSIVEEKMKVSKTHSYEKLPLLKSKSNASEESLRLENTFNSMTNIVDKSADKPELVRISNTSKTLEQKDSNNNKKIIQNETITLENVLSNTDIVDGCGEIPKLSKPVIIETPKPKPRAINRKNLENTFGQRKYDESLTLSKIHCIESWLQDSITCKITHDNSSDIRDEGHEIIRPEVLPRLIDFVPKSTKNQPVSCDLQEDITYSDEMSKENANNIRSLGSKEATEDWCNSAGSPQLETIFEDSSLCPTLLIEESSRHPPAGDSGSDQGNNPGLDDSHPSVLPVILPEITVKEVLCEENNRSAIISENTECAGVAVSRGPRSPPDGRENPAIHHEDMPASPMFENIKFQNNIVTFSHNKNTNNIGEDNKHKNDESNTCQTYLQQTPKKVVKEWEKSFIRSKDDKSNGSVKDKIAMFSANKLSSVEPSEKKIINGNKLEKNNHNVMNRSISLQMEPVTKQYGTYDRKTSPKTAADTVDFAGTLPRANTNKNNNSSILYNRAVSYDNSNETRANSHKTTLNQLIEQRRQSMNKLRGLVIPDSPCVLDLPEIKSRDSLDLSLSSLREDNDAINNKHSILVKTSTQLSSVPSWENQPVITNIPKYSPAFKRKPLQIYGPKISREKNGIPNITSDAKQFTPMKPPRTSLDLKKTYDNKVHTLPSSYKSIHGYFSQTSPYKFSQNSLQTDSKDVVDSIFKSQKGFSDTADSDNDSSYLSTVSSPTPSLNTVDNTESDCSSQSALSQGNDKAFSINNNIFEYNHLSYKQENNKVDVCRSLSSDTSTSGGSNNSTLTSGSQASCSSTGSTDTGSRILKPKSIEAINRKNILASAKCRSGKDKYGSPLIERKFSDPESTDDDTTVKQEPHNLKSRNETVANPIMRVAYSTLVVEDKFSQNETDTTYSDDSDCDYGNVTLSKNELSNRYSNGSAINNTPKNVIKDFNNISNGKLYNAYKGKPSENIEKSLVTENKSPVVNTNVNIKPTCNGTTKKSCEMTNISSCVSEGDQSNLCEVILSRGASGGVGVTLAGGSDCEAKEVTIHKVLQGSAADRDGRLHKGDRVISINGHSMKNLTHAQSVAILKEQLPEVSIVVSSQRKESSTNEKNETNKTSMISVTLNKTEESLGSAGLGISLQGGGIVPLIINKLFTGSAAAKSGKVPVGSELLSIGETKLSGYTRTQAWGILRALPTGPVTLLLKPP